MMVTALWYKLRTNLRTRTLQSVCNPKRYNVIQSRVTQTSCVKIYGLCPPPTASTKRCPSSGFSFLTFSSSRRPQIHWFSLEKSAYGRNEFLTDSRAIRIERIQFVWKKVCHRTIPNGLSECRAFRRALNKTYYSGKSDSNGNHLLMCIANERRSSQFFFLI